MKDPSESVRKDDMLKQVLNSEKYVDRGRSIAKMGGDDKPENGTLVK